MSLPAATISFPAMLRRSRASRAAAWLMMALLALVAGEPLRPHVCPMHDGPVAAAMATAHGSAPHGAAAAGTMTQHADAAHAPAAPSHDGGKHQCRCLGTCCTAAPVALRGAAELAVIAAVRATAVVAPAVAVGLPQSGGVVLPFAIGPPRSA